MADNLATMDDVADLRLAPDGGWIDPTGLDRNQHAIAEPLTGAIFDNIVEFYQDDLVAMGLVPQAADPRGWTVEAVARASGYLRIASARSFTRFAAEFESALHRARDLVGHCMAHVILTVRPETLSFAGVAARFSLEGCRGAGAGAHPAGSAGELPVARHRPAAASLDGGGARRAEVAAAPAWPPVRGRVAEPDARLRLRKPARVLCAPGG